MLKDSAITSVIATAGTVALPFLLGAGIGAGLIVAYIRHRRNQEMIEQLLTQLYLCSDNTINGEIIT